MIHTRIQMKKYELFCAPGQRSHSNIRPFWQGRGQLVIYRLQK